MAAKKPIKKKQMSIKLRSGAKLIAPTDAIPFTTEYTSWEKKAEGLSGETIGMRGVQNSKPDKKGNKTSSSTNTATMNLLEFTEQSGQIRRVKWNGGKSPKSPNKGGMKVMEKLRILKSNSKDLTEEQLDFLDSVIKELEKHKQPNAKTNPANIVFTDPTELTINGSIENTEKVYGHYRTKNYARWRSNKKDADTGKNEKVPMINDAWYSYTQNGTARPPAWQVLYAEDESNSPFNHIGLLEVCKRAYKTIEDLEWDIDPNYPIPITGSKIAQTLYNNIPEVKEEVDSWLATPDNSPFIKTDGTLDRQEASQAFKTVEITLDTAKELKIIQNHLKVPVDIDTIYLDVTPTQCYNMAMLNKNYVKFLRERTYEQRVAVNRRKKKQEARQAVKDKQAKKEGKKDVLQNKK